MLLPLSISPTIKRASRFSPTSLKQNLSYTLWLNKNKKKENLTAGNGQIRNMLKQDDFETTRWPVEPVK